MNDTYILVAVLTVALCTLATRMTPFLLLGRKKELPPPVRYLGSVLPPAIMATLVVYCLKTINFSEISNFLPSLLGVTATAALHLWKKNTLLSICCGTVVYMVLVQAVF